MRLSAVGASSPVHVSVPRTKLSLPSGKRSLRANACWARLRPKRRAVAMERVAGYRGLGAARHAERSGGRDAEHAGVAAGAAFGAGLTAGRGGRRLPEAEGPLLD